MNRLCQLVPINLPTIARSIHTSIFFISQLIIPFPTWHHALFEVRIKRHRHLHTRNTQGEKWNTKESKYKVIFHHYILSDHTRILLLLFLLLTVLAEPTHRLKKSTFELFYKYFLQYDHLIMLKSSVTMKSDGMHRYFSAGMFSWRFSNATTSYVVFLAGFRIFSWYRKRDVWAFAITTESELRLWVELCKLPTLATNDPQRIVRSIGISAR
jgi:hypothetical protein